MSEGRVLALHRASRVLGGRMQSTIHFQIISTHHIVKSKFDLLKLGDVFILDSLHD